MAPKVKKTEEEWRKTLSEEEYHVLREKGTERPFTGKLLHNKKDGTYRCAACGNILFRSEEKYDSHSGWPSFFKPAENKNVELVPDNSLGMRRIEVICSRCGGHLGHVFDDGPAPTGKRYCINSASLKFEASNE
ncbi:MAG: peptide-methionine (R)-S-oxide reductase MsrB [Candidatus Verstraetearchaeota archaeon]|nr:peptide-methionine (R)-S-oxide reductase MsrB [Candidatus Verstraetearchaeota archaeon]